jgi:hypothetical protein
MVAYHKHVERLEDERPVTVRYGATPKRATNGSGGSSGWAMKTGTSSVGATFGLKAKVQPRAGGQLTRDFPTIYGSTGSDCTSQ